MILSQLQDAFHESVGAKHNLERGRKYSGAKHVTMNELYAKQNEAIVRLKVAPPLLTKKDYLAAAAGVKTKNMLLYEQHNFDMRALASKKSMSINEASSELVLAKKAAIETLETLKKQKSELHEKTIKENVEIQKLKQEIHISILSL